MCKIVDILGLGNYSKYFTFSLSFPGICSLHLLVLCKLLLMQNAIVIYNFSMAIQTFRGTCF